MSAPVIDARLIERLAALPSLASVPRAELEWLAAHGELKRYAAGDTLYSSASPPPGCYVVVSGSLSVRVVRDGLARTVNEIRAGDISGRLPYSRMPSTGGSGAAATPHFTSVAEEPTEILLIADATVREMARECYDVTAQCVHQMVDRARLFKLDDLQREKMASLGRLAAGLAHELNNPSSAAARSALVMDACRRQVVTATRALAAAGLADGELAVVEALDAKAEAAPEEGSPLDAADREEVVLDWLEARGLDPGMAEPLARASISAADLGAAASALPARALEAAVRYVATNAMANQLTKEIERATRRIDLLVAAVKRHTHMDRAPVVELIDVEPTLADTIVLAESKARAKSVVLTLDAEPGLPQVPGVAGQLNDVWMNLVDNATDAAPMGGQVTVAARRGPEVVIVSVTDNGPGIPAADQTRVFEPFFTTKPVGQGAGLGLDVVQRVVRSHGGAVELHSAPGRTEFRVTLPVRTAPPAPAHQPTASPSLR